MNINDSVMIQYEILRVFHDFCDGEVKAEIDCLLEREN